MRESGRFIPLFTDKHLSYAWDHALEMYNTSIENGFGLMAGSSVVLAHRLPPLGDDIDAGTTTTHSPPASECLQELPVYNSCLQLLLQWRVAMQLIIKLCTVVVCRRGGHYRRGGNPRRADGIV